MVVVIVVLQTSSLTVSEIQRRFLKHTNCCFCLLNQKMSFYSPSCQFVKSNSLKVTPQTVSRELLKSEINTIVWKLIREPKWWRLKARDSSNTSRGKALFIYMYRYVCVSVCVYVCECVCVSWDQRAGRGVGPARCSCRGCGRGKSVNIIARSE